MLCGRRLLRFLRGERHRADGFAGERGAPLLCMNTCVCVYMNPMHVSICKYLQVDVCMSMCYTVYDPAPGVPCVSSFFLSKVADLSDPGPSASEYDEDMSLLKGEKNTGNKPFFSALTKNKSTATNKVQDSTSKDTTTESTYSFSSFSSLFLETDEGHRD